MFDHDDFLQLSLGLLALRHVHVHFIAVEVGVVGGGHAQVESEGRKWEYFDAVAHHAHFVERWLAVEQHDVVGDDVAFHYVPDVQVAVQVNALGQVDHHAIFLYDVVGTRVYSGPVVDELLQPEFVPVVDCFGEGQMPGN